LSYPVYSASDSITLVYIYFLGDCDSLLRQLEDLWITTQHGIPYTLYRSITESLAGLYHAAGDSWKAAHLFTESLAITLRHKSYIASKKSQ